MSTDWIEGYFGNKDSTIARDLKVNLGRFLSEGELTIEDRFLTLAALAKVNGDQALIQHASDALVALGVSAEHIQEAIESAALMSMLNVYYKFRGLVQDPGPYQTAGLRMTSLAKPALGKVKFEMLAFAVSVHNGCPSCVTSHEQVLLKHGITHGQIHDLARLSAIVRAVSVLKQGS